MTRMPSGSDERTRALAVFGQAAALALVAVALLLPWSREDGVVRDAFAGHPVLSLLALLAAASTTIATALLAAAPGTRRARAVQVASITTGIPALVAGLVVTGSVDADERQWWGLGLFAPALIASMVLASLLPARAYPSGEVLHRDAVRRGGGRRALLVPGVAALGVAGVGLTATWQRMTGPVVDTLTDGDALVWRGTEVSGTLALRWAIPAAIALCLLLAAVRPARRALPLALIAAGVAVTAFTAARLPQIPVQGTNAAVGIGTGAWLTLAGGAAAALCGLAALELPGRARLRSALPAVTAVAVTIPLLSIAVPHAGAAAGDEHVQQVLGTQADTQSRLGGPSVRAAYDTGPTYGPIYYRGPHLPDLASSLDGGPGTWFMATVDVGTDEHAFVVEEIVDGRALPVTVVHGPEKARLLGVSGHHAIMYAARGETYFVSLIDLRRGDAETDPRIGDGDWSFGTTTVLTNSVRSMRPSKAPAPGVVRAEDLHVELTADGSAVVYVDPRNDDLDKAAYRVDAATVRGTEAWQLTRRLATRAGAPSAARYTTGATTIWRIGRDGERHVAVGGVSDPRCAPSRDPLSSAIFTYGRSAVPDRDGNVWMIVAPYGAPQSKSRLYVLTPDGVLRSPGSRWEHALGMQPQPDGSLYLTLAAPGGSSVSPRVGATYRIADSTAFARAAPALPPVAEHCVSDNRVSVHTDGRHVRRDGTVPEIPTGTGRIGDTALLRTDGTILASRYTERPEPDEHGSRHWRWELLRAAPGRPPAVVYSTDSARIGGILADGHGGAWWIERHIVTTDEGSHDGTASLGHVDASGRARIVARGVAPEPGSSAPRSVPLAVDRNDGSLWWRAIGAWHRITTTGTITRPRLQHSAESLIVAGGAGFAVVDDVVYRISASRSGLGPAVLGSDSGLGLRLPSALASGAKAEDVDTDGILLATSDGRLLIYQGDYLAVLDASGKLQALAGPGDGLPAESDVAELCVIANTLVVETDDDAIYTVDVS